MLKNLFFVICLSLSITLNAQVQVLAFAGSTRAESVNKKLVQQAANLASELGAEVKFIDLKDYPLPIYDADLEAQYGMPENAKLLQNLMVNSQVILIASPEYNGSLTGLLKNTIDWVSRSPTKSASREAFQRKKFALMSASPGPMGGAKGLLHLQTILQDIGGIVTPQYVTVGKANQAFDEKGTLKDPKTYSALKKLIKNTIQK